jgi:excisionase family DNA binding protein
MSETYLLTSDVSRRLGVSSETVRQWERTGALKATKTAGGVRVFRASDVTQFEAIRKAAQRATQATNSR